MFVLCNSDESTHAVAMNTKITISKGYCYLPVPVMMYFTAVLFSCWLLFSLTQAQGNTYNQQMAEIIQKLENRMTAMEIDLEKKTAEILTQEKMMATMEEEIMSLKTELVTVQSSNTSSLYLCTVLSVLS